jgi:hypothetical protein
MASLSSDDKMRVRTHLGYPDTDTIGQGYAGLVWSSDNLNQLEYAMNEVREGAIPTIQKFLSYLDRIEAQQIDALGRLRAVKADVVTLNKDEHSELLVQYKHWQGRLATQIGARVNPFQESSGVSLNITHSRPK